MKRVLAASLLGGMMSVAPAVETWGPASGHTVLDVRAYSNGSLVMRLSPALNAGCTYNDHVTMPASSPAYKLVSAMAMTAYVTGRKVLVIYDGCNGNVNLMGLLLLES